MVSAKKTRLRSITEPTALHLSVTYGFVLASVMNFENEARSKIVFVIFLSGVTYVVLEAVALVP